MRFSDPSGHYGQEEVHYNLTYAIVYQMAYEKLKSYGLSEQARNLMATTIAEKIASADAGVDSSESPLPRPGTYPQCGGRGGCNGSSETITIETAHHWYTTPQAEDELKSAESLEDFGVALHAYQDSFSHWQKLGQPDTPGAIWDGHAQNLIDSRSGRAASIDTFDPSIPYSTDWVMVMGMVYYVDSYLDDYLPETVDTTEAE